MYKASLSVRELLGFGATESQDLEAVESLLHAGVRSSLSLPRELSERLVASGGKRIRPLLVTLSYRSVHNSLGSKMARATLTDLHQLAAVAEWVHMATLFHDDVLDHTHERRGQKTAHTIAGNKNAILVGDFVYAEAFALLMDRGLLVPSQKLAHTVKRLVEGELIQHRVCRERSAQMDDYIRIALSKTASLFAWCTETGAWAAGFEDPSVAFTAGLELGKAFQMADDLSDTFAWDPETAHFSSVLEFADSAPPLPLVIAATEDKSVLEAWSKLDVNGNPDRLRREVVNLVHQLRRQSWIHASADRVQQSLAVATQALRQMQASESLLATVQLIGDLSERALESAEAKA